MTLETSARWFEENKTVLAGGVSSDVRKAELPHPLYFESGSGSRIRDVDGNSTSTTSWDRGHCCWATIPARCWKPSTGNWTGG